MSPIKTDHSQRHLRRLKMLADLTVEQTEAWFRPAAIVLSRLLFAYVSIDVLFRKYNTVNDRASVLAVMATRLVLGCAMTFVAPSIILATVVYQVLAFKWPKDWRTPVSLPDVEDECYENYEDDDCMVCGELVMPDQHHYFGGTLCKECTEKADECAADRAHVRTCKCGQAMRVEGTSPAAIAYREYIGMFPCKCGGWLSTMDPIAIKEHVLPRLGIFSERLRCECGHTACQACGMEPCECVPENVLQKGNRRCRKCNMEVNRTGGCNHMTCICGHEFCYICGKQWSYLHSKCAPIGKDQYWRGLRSYPFATSVAWTVLVTIGAWFGLWSEYRVLMTVLSLPLYLVHRAINPIPFAIFFVSSSFTCGPDTLVMEACDTLIVAGAILKGRRNHQNK